MKEKGEKKLNTLPYFNIEANETCYWLLKTNGLEHHPQARASIIRQDRIQFFFSSINWDGVILGKGWASSWSFFKKA